MDGIIAFVNDHFLIIGIFLAIGFILSEIYLMPEDMKFGQGEIRTVKALWKWTKEKVGKPDGDVKTEEKSNES